MFLDRLKRKFKKPKQVLSLEVNRDRCTGCGVCEKRCKRNVFTMDRDNNCAVVSVISDCVGCGKCVYKMCKFGAINLVIV